MKNYKKRENSNYYIIGTYTVLTLIMTYPFVFNITRYHAPGDYNMFLWNMWWVKKAVLSFSSPYYTNFMFYPGGIDLSYHTFSMFNALVAIPLSVFFSRITIYNLLFLLSFIIGAFGVYLLVKYLVGNKYAAFISGLVFAFSPFHFAHSLGHLNLLSIEWIPFFILYFIKTFREPGKKNPLLSGIFLALTSLCSWYYMIYAILFMLLFFMYWLWYDRAKFELSFFTKYSLTLLVFFIIVLPFSYPMLKVLLRGDSYFYRGNQYTGYVADSIAFITPPWYHPVWGGVFEPIRSHFTGNYAENTVFLGFSVIGLSIYSILKIKSKEVRFWFISAVTFMIFSLGPVLHVLGYSRIPINNPLLTKIGLTKILHFLHYPFISVGLPLPYYIFNYVPLIKAARVPSRFVVMLMLSLSVLVGYGCSKIFGKLGSKRMFSKFSAKKVVAGVISLVVVFEFLRIPFTIRSFNVPIFYKDLAKDKQKYAILELPLYGWGNNEEFMCYQTIHEKKIVNGMAARIPPYCFNFVENSEFLSLLAHPERIDKKSMDISSSILRNTNIKYIIVHQDWFKVESEQYLNKLEIFLDNKFERQIVKEEEDLSVYKVY